MTVQSKKITDFIIPSIDLLDGEIIRLKQGDYNNKTKYELNIDDLLEKYKDFAFLHVVNLNGAKGEKNEKIISEIRKKFKGKIQVGGGFRDIEKNRFLSQQNQH